MSSSPGRALRPLGNSFRAIRRRARLATACLLVVLVSASLGAWRYAVTQWHSAEAALKGERLDEARERLAFCQRVWPRSPEVHLLAARAARLVNDYAEAEAQLNRCIELQGGASDEVQLEFLLLRVQTGEVDALAPALFDAIDKGNPQAGAIMQAIARAYITRLRYKLATACLTKWIEMEPENPRPYHWRGWAMERLNNHKGAEADYLRALELDPDLVPVRLRVAEMRLEDKQAPEALPHLERLMRQAPDDPQVQARMGICLFLLGRGDEGRKLMDAAVVHMPNDPALLVALANHDLQQGRAAEAESWLRTALKADPADTESLFVLASALRLQGKADEAAATLVEYAQKRDTVERINELLKSKADNPAATAADYEEIGRLFLQIGRNKYGTYWLEKAIERDPNYQPARRALAEHYAKSGRPTADEGGDGPPSPTSQQGVNQP